MSNPPIFYFFNMIKGLPSSVSGDGADCTGIPAGTVMVQKADQCYNLAAFPSVVRSQGTKDLKGDGERERERERDGELKG